MTETPSITGLMLAGGRGRRMNGADKGLLELGGRSLASHTLARLASQTSRQIISANRSLREYRALGVPVVTDLRPGYPGPLAGIEAALRQADSDFLLVVPCDAPLLPLDLAGRLYRALQAAGGEIAVASDGVRPQFLHALLRTRLATDLSAYLDQGQRAVFAWYRRQPVVEVDFSDQTAGFANINSPEDLQAMAQRLAGDG